MSPDPYFSIMGFRSITPKSFEIFEGYFVGLENRSMWHVILKNDNSACFHFFIMSPDPYFFFILVSGA